ALNGALAAEKLVEAIWSEINALPAFDDSFSAMVQEKLATASHGNRIRAKEIESQCHNIGRQIERITSAIAEVGGSPSLYEKLGALEAEDATLRQELAKVSAPPVTKAAIPSIDEIKRLAVEAFQAFAPADPEVGRLMHRLIPDIRVYPYQLIDGGKVVL